MRTRYGAQTERRSRNISMRVLFWNLHATPAACRRSERVEAAAATIAEVQPDVVLLQEV